MKTYEKQLTMIVTADAWEIPALKAFEQYVHDVGILLGRFEDGTRPLGWNGASAEQAKAAFANLRGQLASVQPTIDKIRSALSTAESHRSEARTALANLPSTDIPWWVHAGAIGGAAFFAGPILGTIAAESAIAVVQNHLNDQRETAAQNVLAELHRNLEGPRATIIFASPAGGILPPRSPTPIDESDDTWPHGYGHAGGVGAYGGGVSNGGGGGEVPPHDWRDPFPTDPPIRPLPPGHSVSVDGGGNGASGFGGGLGSALGGAGLGAGALAAGSKLAGAKSGGLFPAGSVAPGGAGGGGNSAMMGGGGGAGGGGDKEKRAQLGLVAPKLEDDEEPAPRSASAGAGGRDQ